MTQGLFRCHTIVTFGLPFFRDYQIACSNEANGQQ